MQTNGADMLQKKKKNRGGNPILQKLCCMQYNALPTFNYTEHSIMTNAMCNLKRTVIVLQEAKG